MTGSGISVDGYGITACGGRDVAGGSTGWLYITFESGATYSHLSDQPASYDASGCFSYYGYLDSTPIVAVSVDGIGDWSGSNWWVDDPPLPPPPPEPEPAPEPEPVAPPSDPAPVADSPGPAPADVTTDAPLTKVADGVVAPDFTATPFPTPTAKPTITGETYISIPVSTPTPEPVTGEAFALDPLTATLGVMALGAAGGAAYLAIKTGVRR